LVAVNWDSKIVMAHGHESGLSDEIRFPTNSGVLTAWCRTQFSTLAESLKEIANKIARLEVLIYVLD
jgi:hypothetical protein